MSSDAIITHSGLGKKYRIRHHARQAEYATLRELIGNKVRSLFVRSSTAAKGARPAAQEDFWALKDVSCEIRRGEVVGIIGRNGAGKSTLLKILSRITEPSEGRVRLKGRVASLLEVGTGFHAELTGRENIFLNGAILGMSRREIHRKFDEIVAFSEVEKFLDTPVKRYSSGMYVRLAFAVAAHLEPEILIVDEVLAVGDAQFQKKCLGKLQDVAGKDGRTVLFVSHNMLAIRNLCSRGLFLKSGTLRFDGKMEAAIEAYLGEEQASTGEVSWAKAASPPGDEAMKLLAVRVRSEGQITSSVYIDRAVEIEIDYETLVADLFATVSIHLNIMGACAFVGGPPSFIHPRGAHRAVCTIPASLLNNGAYHVSVFLITNVTHLRVVERDVITFSVEEKDRVEYLGEVIGAVRPKLEWAAQPLPNPAQS